ncbi:hypothetical protein LO772_09855 [Yinghuangia sp. ASG 101]|uniref:hypothetical protein n=1 Tax=Yinghuangia sp. ASG 101 TaxID=2896848 RepID=UPI001E512629|nr:hypothetical protein [Yinghuangia sp. ASG 101]UGQ13867.1 hypothetical protein LO772_09855 [Yinghuangia sp. ASG 101]
MGTQDRVTHQDERALLTEVRLLFGAIDPWLADFMRATTAPEGPLAEVTARLPPDAPDR